MQSQDGNVILKDVPYGLWIFGLVFGGMGVGIGLVAGAPIWFMLIFGVIGLSMLLFTPVLTVSMDRNRGMLTLHRAGIITRSSQDVRINEISDIYVARKVSRDEDGTSVTYQVRILLESGEEVPLRKYSSSGFRGKEKQATKLRDAIGLDERPLGFQTNLNRWDSGRAIRRAVEEDQREALGVSEGQQVTDDVTWELQTHTFSTSPVTRWVSTDVQTPGYFVYIAQKQPGQGAQKGVMNLLGKTLFKQSLKMYGYDASFTPGIEQAVVFEEADRRLMEAFFIFASTDRDVYRLLNPWVVTPLVAWADRHPLETSGQQYSQLTVLFSPKGLYISAMGGLNTHELDQITTLGVELVKSATP